MKIGDLSKRTGLSSHTIRYYEKIGLLPPAGRDGAGHRDYGDDILSWIEFLGHLKSTGMPIRDMLRYAALRDMGPSTGPERRALLQAHQQDVRRRVAKLQENLAVLDAKIKSYSDQENEVSK